LKAKAQFAPDGRAPVMGRTADIGANGVSVTFDGPVEASLSGTLRFDLVVDGKVTPVNARTKVSHCIFSSGQFKVGLQFVSLEPAASAALTRFLR
jgi:c-di-GMP-binding flagellar brake protein YcgR